MEVESVICLPWVLVSVSIETVQAGGEETFGENDITKETSAAGVDARCEVDDRWCVGTHGDTAPNETAEQDQRANWRR